MNCRSFAVALFVSVGLVPTAQPANAGTPTLRQATATATILPIATNNTPTDKKSATVKKFIGADGHLTTVKGTQSRPIIIIDLP